MNEIHQLATKGGAERRRSTFHEGAAFPLAAPSSIVGIAAVRLVSARNIA